MGDQQLTQISIGKIPKAIILGTVVGIITTLILTAIWAWTIDAEKIGEGSSGYVSFITLFLSSVIGSLVSVGINKQKRLPICLLVGCTYFLSLISITALFYKGAYQGVGETLLVIASGVISVALIGLKSGNKSRNRVRR